MLSRMHMNVLRGSQPMQCMLKRNWTQVGNLVCTPPRVKCTYSEKILHALAMMTVWLTPMAYFMSQLKVWRRTYIE